MTDYNNLIITQDDRVTIIAINRHARRNSVNGETARELFEAFQNFDQDGNSDIAILTGMGGTFCAGADLKALADGEDSNPFEEGGINTLAPMGISRMQLSKPVIAAIEGHAVAGGMELALWCDLRVMAEDAIMGIFCRRFGVPLVDMGTIRLPRLIGQSRAMDLALTGRPVDATEAEHIGLANRISASGKALETAAELAKEIAKFPQACMRSDRQSMLDQWSLDTEAAIHNETKLGMETINSGETVAGATRFSSGEGRHGKFGEE